MPAESEPALGSLRHPLTRALLLLTFTTGIVDVLVWPRVCSRSEDRAWAP